MRSRAIWLTEGDHNIKKIHKFATDRKVRNTIWELNNSKGTLVQLFKDLVKEGESYFKNFYKDQGIWSIDDLLKPIYLFPSFFSPEDNEKLEEPTTETKLKVTLSRFQRSKSPGLDGWTLEFFEDFIDFISEDLIRVLNEWRVKGQIPRAMKSTFISLIQRKPNPNNFDEFRMIALCNMVYNIGAKLLANKLKGGLCGEKSSFLNNRQILNVVGSTQDGLHSVKVNKAKALDLMLDLKKAYGHANWSMMR